MDNKIPKYCKVFIPEIQTFSFFIITNDKFMIIGNETFFLEGYERIYRSFQGRQIVVDTRTMEITLPKLHFFNKKRLIPVSLSDFGNGFNLYV